ncbi:hypothetical protein Glove_318g31 [Diversispora epigaea]|uniref:BTB domain-containing protein n=1 Tax=Diversispora epigaea TaxID=1348612 RepID=A0A397HXI2_9GLOM|nr:hypothetical protein Glove_318g31 [Diversispora epigaea]
MALKFFDMLSQNFIELLGDKDDYNVIIEVENKEKSFTAHSSVLKYRSSYFRRKLENVQPNENNIKVITESSISAQIFDAILKYIYGGIVNLENAETRFIFDLMSAANEFKLEELANKLLTLLIEAKGSWLEKHFPLVYRTIYDGQNFKKLENYYKDMFAKNPNLIFDSSDFTSLQESAMVSLLKRNDLQIKEDEIWDYVIKWGVAQNPTLPTNLEEWSKENFLTLKTTLQQCLPHIRYFHLSADEVLDSIKPYKKILEKQLWEDINQRLLAPDRPVKSIILPPRSPLVKNKKKELPPHINKPKENFSTIISEDHAAEISTWIDRKPTNYLTTNIPYKFELVLRGTRDGFAPQTFWDICEGYGGTVVVMKVKGKDEIFGGYNPLAWETNNSKKSWIETKDSFIFSLKNGNIQNSILSRVKNPKKAIRNMSKKELSKNGPHFGYDFSMYSPKFDFTLDEKCSCANSGSLYEGSISISSANFSIVNYEVFKIVRKS